MAEGEDAEKGGEAAAAGEKKPVMQSKAVKILLGLALIAALGSITVLVAYYVSQFVKMGEVTAEQGAVDQGATEKIQEPPNHVPMGTFISILSDEAGQTYNLKITLSLIVNKDRPDEKEATAELGLRKTQLTDALNEVLIGTDPKSFTGSPAKRREGYNELRDAITRAVNARMKAKIDGVFIEEFIFQ